MASLSNNFVQVGISMVLRDQFSQGASRMASNYRSLLNDMNTANQMLTQSLGTAFDTGTEMMGAMYDSFKHSAGIQKEIFLTGEISGATAEQQQHLLDVTRQLNAETPLTNTDIASGMKYLAMAGNGADKLEAMIKPAARLSSIFGMELGGKGGVADLMTNIMSTFNMASTEADKLADALGTATTNSNMNLMDLAQAIQYSGAQFRMAGIDVNTASAAIGVMADQGIQASSAGTALANMLRYLQLSISGQKEKGAEWLKRVGLSPQDFMDAQGNLKNLDEMMQILAAKVQNLSPMQRALFEHNVFGVRGTRAADALMNDVWTGNNKLTKLMDLENNSEGWSEGMMDKYLETDQGKLDQLNAAIDNWKTSWGMATSGVFAPAITAIAGGINWLGETAKTEIGTIVARMFTIGTAITTAVAGFNLFRFTVRNIMNYSSSISRSITQINTKMSSGTARTNGYQSRMLMVNNMQEGHLAQMVSILGGIASFRMPGHISGWKLPYGGKITRNGFIGPNGQSVSSAQYPGMIYPQMVHGRRFPMGGGGNPAPNQNNPTTSPMGLGSMLGMMVGGWWGVGLTLGITALTSIIPALAENTAAQKANTDAIYQQISQMSNQEYASYYQDKFMTAWRKAMEKNQGRGGDLTFRVNAVDNGSRMGLN